MSCLSTSGRRGLGVIVGARYQPSQKFLSQLFLSYNLSRSLSMAAPQDGRRRTSTSTSTSMSTATATATRTALPPTAATASTMPCAGSSFVAQRSFHGLTTVSNGARTCGTVPRANPANKDYFASLQNTNNNNNSDHQTGNYTPVKYSKLHNYRQYSSVHTQQPAGPVREIQIDPYIMLDDELKYFYDDVRDMLQQGTSQTELETIATYYFDGQGKALRPMVTMLMAKAINYHLNKESSQLVQKQRKIALFSEMVHSASLVHDDVIDQSNFRRGKPSVNALWNHKKVTMAGDYILSVASIMIARLKNDDVMIILSQILTDLVQGEFMQLGSKETENERFAHYLTKTYRKTASLIANTLKATAVIADADENIAEMAFQYGRNIGLAFQLVDDMLDFVSSTEAMGKPTAADLKLGLATAPVLFACEKYPELNPMIMRRFNEPGDVERAFELVHKSHGLEQTRFLAKKHCIEAIRLAQQLTDSPYQKGLQVVADLVINRLK